MTSIHLFLGAALAATLALQAPPAAATPRLPGAGSDVIETLPRRNDPQQRELRRLRLELMAAPHNAELAAALAQRYIVIGRSESDPRYFGYAQAALAPWWNQAAPPASIRLLRATLRQNIHQFAAALTDLDAVTAAEPSNAQAWLTRATVQTVLGQYSAATASCARLSALADQLSSITCLTNVSGLSGRLLKSDMLLATTLQRSSNAAPALQAWSLTQLAEMAARRGERALAETRFQAALKLAPRDSYLLGAYADFLLDQQRSADAAALTREQRRIDGLLLRHALALKQQIQSQMQVPGQRQGQRRAPELAQQLEADTRELQARFDAAAMRGDSVHQREQARYELHLRGNAQAALALAQRNWAVQKEPADLRILLEAALQAGDRAAAGPALAWMAQTALEDAAISPLAAQLRPATASASAASRTGAPQLAARMQP